MTHFFNQTLSAFNQIQSWFSQAQATVTEEKLQPLPSEISNKLNQIIDNLSY